MDKKLFQQNFAECLDRNFDKNNKYFDYEYSVFFEFGSQVFQIVKCLILELDYAGITLTNNLLERLLKNALISKAVGIGPIPVENWNAVFSEADVKYSSCKLGNTIELCKKESLISQEDKDILFSIIRDQIRNGFSHSEPSKILDGLPDEIEMYQANFAEPTNLNKVNLNHKVIPSLQSMSLENFTKANASGYFDYVFTLMQKIEIRLVEIGKQKKGET